MKKNKSMFYDKRGILTKTLLQILIGVICVLVLFGLAGKMLSLNYKEKQAKSSLDKIVEKANYLEEHSGQKNVSILILNPNEWNIIKGERIDELCICSEDSFELCSEDLCESLGVSLDFKNRDKIEIDQPIELFIEINEQTGFFEVYLRKGSD